MKLRRYLVKGCKWKDRWRGIGSEKGAFGNGSRQQLTDAPNTLITAVATSNQLGLFAFRSGLRPGLGVPRRRGQTASPVEQWISTDWNLSDKSIGPRVTPQHRTKSNPSEVHRDGKRLMNGPRCWAIIQHHCSQTKMKWGKGTPCSKLSNVAEIKWDSSAPA